MGDKYATSSIKAPIDIKCIAEWAYIIYYNIN